MGIYCASKSFDNFLTISLASEYKNEIDIIALKPGYVATPMIAGKATENVITPA